MKHYITGSTIKALRESKNMTQTQLAEQIGVSGKAVSKWETGKGLPDVSLLQPLAKALGVSVQELLSGETVINHNISANMLRSRFYVCPVCGNVIHAMGDALISCCGITLPPCEADEADDDHRIMMQPVEDEHFLHIDHPMTKDHFISFMAYVTADRVQLVKLYPEGNAETRLQLRGTGVLYTYCNHHGLMKQPVRRQRKSGL